MKMEIDEGRFAGYFTVDVVAELPRGGTAVLAVGGDTYFATIAQSGRSYYAGGYKLTTRPGRTGVSCTMGATNGRYGKRGYVVCCKPAENLSTT